MFYYLKGKLVHIEPPIAVIDVGGVGYACHTSLTSLAQVNVSDEVVFYTYLHVREDIMDLYGFADAEELSCFKMLISVSGVGPKAALAILSVVTPTQLAIAIAGEDDKPLIAASGVGKKMAQRIILELRDKIAKEQGITTERNVSLPQVAGNTVSEAAAALAVLGYSRAEIEGALKGIDAEGLEVEQIIKKALLRLMR